MLGMPYVPLTPSVIANLLILSFVGISVLGFSESDRKRENSKPVSIKQFLAKAGE